jgi:hypothetical protein
MNTKKQKENQETWKPPYCQKAGAFQQADRQKRAGTWVRNGVGEN